LWSLLGARHGTTIAGIPSATGEVAIIKELKPRTHQADAGYGRKSSDLSTADPASDHRRHLERHHLRGARSHCRLASALPEKVDDLRTRPRRSCGSHSSWPKLDVVDFSWQRTRWAGEGRDGLLVLSPRRPSNGSEDLTGLPGPLPRLRRTRAAS